MNKIDHFQEKPLKRVGIYLRLSDEDKDKTNKEENSESIKNQRHMLLEEINKRKDFLFVDEYCDEDLSGAGTYRPEFERLIEDCKNQKLDVVLCKSQSRFSRDMEIIEKYLHNKFIEWNIRFIGLTDNADTANTGNKKSRQINGLVNEWYLEDVSNNIRSAFQTKMKQGEFISPFAPFGYEISSLDNNKLIIDQLAAIIVKKIFDLYLIGYGYTRIADFLNEKGIPSPSFYKFQKGSKLNVTSKKERKDIRWNGNAIKKILTNEVYLGHLIQGKRTTISYKNHKIRKKSTKEWIKVKNTHDAIIEEETFKQVQQRIKERFKPIKKTGMVHLLSKKVYCLECSSIMRKKNTNNHEYLACSKRENGKEGCVNKHSIRYDLLEKILLEEINKKIAQYYNEELLQKEIIQNNSKQKELQLLDNQLIELKKKLEKNKQYFKALYEDKVNNNITKEQFKTLQKEYSKKEIEYNNYIKELLRKKQNYNQGKILLQGRNSFKVIRKLTFLNRFIIEEFISKIYIGKINLKTQTRIIQIEWNF